MEGMKTNNFEKSNEGRGDYRKKVKYDEKFNRSILEEHRYSEDEYMALMQDIENSFKSVKEGDIIKGKVIAKRDDAVIVDVGFKSDGEIPIYEFVDINKVQIGEQIDVFIVKSEDANGRLILSKARADFQRVYDAIKEAHESDKILSGKVLKRVKGGFVVDLMGINAFLPGSQIANRKINNLDDFVGKEIEFKIVKINKLRRNVVVSRKAVLEEKNNVKKDDILKTINVGDIREGIVKNITNFGAFIDLDGVDGLLHITDISWGRISHPSEVLKIGDKINVKVIGIDNNTNRISLGLKQLKEHPWENVALKYPEGTKIKGKVVNIVDYGIFVEIEEGLEGLVHLSEMTWTQHIKHPSNLVKKGDEIEAIVLKIDKENQKISLGMKQLQPDPWTIVEKKYPLDTVFEGIIRYITDFGMFVEIEPGIDGLVHITDFSWTKRINHPSEIYKVGDKIKVKVIKVDAENRKISLGIKQLYENPWETLAKKYSVGANIECVITNIGEKGVLVDFEEIEGFIPLSQISGNNLDEFKKKYNVNDKINVKIIEINAPNHRLVLSERAYIKEKDKLEVEEYLEKKSISDVDEK